MATALGTVTAVWVTAPASALAGVGAAGASVGAAVGIVPTTVVTGVGVLPITDVASAVLMPTAVGAGAVMDMGTAMGMVITPAPLSSTTAVWWPVRRRATG